MSSRVGLVTGGTGGIGTAICRRLAASGHRVATNYRNEERARGWQARMKADGFDFALGKGDVSTPEEPRASVPEVQRPAGPAAPRVTHHGIPHAGPHTLTTATTRTTA